MCCESASQALWQQAIKVFADLFFKVSAIHLKNIEPWLYPPKSLARIATRFCMALSVIRDG
jgi:hypothetical protein